MFSSLHSNLYTAAGSEGNQLSDFTQWALYRSEQLFRQERRAAFWQRIWRRLRGQPNDLLELTSFQQHIRLIGSHYCGLQPVSFEQIVGSECRCQDFDASFHPLREHNRMRWQQIAFLCLTHQPLPPVELTRIQERFFVRDGHHRISVARSLGQTAIDAEITELEVCGALQWEAGNQAQTRRSHPSLVWSQSGQR